MAWRVEVNRSMAWRWAAKLGIWVVFVLGLALLFPSLRATPEEIACLIVPAVIFVGLAMFGSFCMAHIKLWLSAAGWQSRAAHRIHPTANSPLRPPVQPSVLLDS